MIGQRDGVENSPKSIAFVPPVRSIGGIWTRRRSSVYYCTSAPCTWEGSGSVQDARGGFEGIGMGVVGIISGSSLTDFVSRSWEVLFVVDRDNATVETGSVGAATLLGSKPSVLRGLCCLCLFEDVGVSEWNEYVAHLDRFPDGFVTLKTTLRRPSAHWRTSQDDPAARAVSVTLQTFEASTISCTVHHLEWRPFDGSSETHTTSGAQLGFSPPYGETDGLCSSPQVHSETQPCSLPVCKHLHGFDLEEPRFTDADIKCQLADLPVATESFSSLVTGAPPHQHEHSAESKASKQADGAPGSG